MLRRYVSRDRNIVQFYGACVQTNSLLLVIELMEVRVFTSSLWPAAATGGFMLAAARPV